MKITYNRELAQEKIVEQIRDCGQALIDNAEIIAGGYQYQVDPLKIKILIEEEEIPQISVGQNFIPEAWIENKRGNTNG